MENNVKERIAAIDNEMEALEEKMADLKHERWELERENSGYFIVNLYCGDGNYWDEYLYSIGLTTEENAKKIAEKLNDLEEDYWLGSLPPYFEVSLEQFRLFEEWENLKKAERALKWCGGPVFSEMRMEIIKQIRAVFSKINIESISRNGDDGTGGFIHLRSTDEIRKCMEAQNE